MQRAGKEFKRWPSFPFLNIVLAIGPNGTPVCLSSLFNINGVGI